MKTIRGRWIGLVAAIIVMDPLLVSTKGQGIIIDRRPGVPISHSYEIREVSIDGRVRDQVAEVQVSQTFHNPGSFQLEAEFLFPLPEEGAIQNFVLMVDGRELPGRLLPKDEARRIYEDIVRSKRDPALLEYMGRGLYRTSVFPIPPGADRKVTMRYTQLCKRDRDVVEFSYPLSTQKFTAKPIQRLIVQVSIQSKDAIKSVYCPSDDARIDRSGDHDVQVSLERRDIVPSNDFRLVYTLADGKLSASVLSFRPSESEDGYFLRPGQPRGQGRRHQAAPQDGRLRHRPLGIDGRQEDRASSQGPQVGAQQPARRRPVQHRGLRRSGRELQARAPALWLDVFAMKPSGSSTTSARGEAPTSTRHSRRPWR